MDAERTKPAAGLDLAQEAESLVRSLAGVAHACVSAGPRGIEAIDIVATDSDNARQMAGRVRSALLAALATPVLPARIHVRVGTEPAAAAARAGAGVPANGRDRGYHRIRMIQRDGADVDDGPRDRPTPPPPAAARAEAPDEDVHADAAEPGPFVRRPRLVAVDTERRPDGRIHCRVSVAYDTRVHSADAIAVDLPGAAAQTAAQATVRALADAGITGLELNGLREVEIAGRDYLVVALRRTDTSRRHRSGSAPIIGSAERSAAEATVVAANDLI